MSNYNYIQYTFGSDKNEKGEVYTCVFRRA